MATSENTPTLRDILARVVDQRILPAQLNPEISLQGDLNIDSPMLVDIVLDLEACYSIRVSDDELTQLRTVGDLIGLIPDKDCRHS